MSDEDHVARCVGKLDAPARAVLDAFVRAPGHRRTAADLVGVASEAEVEPLKRVALLFDDDEHDGPGWFLPRPSRGCSNRAWRPSPQGWRARSSEL